MVGGCVYLVYLNTADQYSISIGGGQTTEGTAQPSFTRLRKVWRASPSTNPIPLHPRSVQRSIMLR